jgi:hypothetical protein
MSACSLGPAPSRRSVRHPSRPRLCRPRALHRARGAARARRASRRSRACRSALQAARAGDPGLDADDPAVIVSVQRKRLSRVNQGAGQDVWLSGSIPIRTTRNLGGTAWGAVGRASRLRGRRAWDWAPSRALRWASPTPRTGNTGPTVGLHDGDDMRNHARPTSRARGTPRPAPSSLGPIRPRAEERGVCLVRGAARARRSPRASIPRTRRKFAHRPRHRSFPAKTLKAP